MDRWEQILVDSQSKYTHFYTRICKHHQKYEGHFVWASRVNKSYHLMIYHFVIILLIIYNDGYRHGCHYVYKCQFKMYVLLLQMILFSLSHCIAIYPNPQQHDYSVTPWTLQWRYHECDGVSNHLRFDCLLDRFSIADQRRHQRSSALAFVRGIQRWPVDSPHKGPVTRKLFSFDDVIMDNMSRRDCVTLSQNGIVRFTTLLNGT